MDCIFHDQLTIATPNVIEVEKVIDISTRADIVGYSGVFNDISTVEGAYVIPALIAVGKHTE